MSAYKNKLVSGKGEGIFDPSGQLTRAEAVTMIVKGMEYEIETESDAKFEDISDAWYTDYIKTAYERKIIAGKSETIFDPNQNVTRAEYVRMLYNASMSAYDKDAYYAVMIPDDMASFELKSEGETVFTYDADTKKIDGEVRVKNGSDWKMVYFDSKNCLELSTESPQMNTIRLFANGRDIGIDGQNISKIEFDENRKITFWRGEEDKEFAFIRTGTNMFIESADLDSVESGDIKNVDTPYRFNVYATGARNLKPSPNGILQGDLVITHSASQWFRFTQLDSYPSVAISVNMGN